MIELLVCVSFEVLLFMFLLIFKIIPIKKYWKKEHIIQLRINSCSFLLILGVFIVGNINPTIYEMNNSILDNNIVFYIVFLVGIFEVGSIFKFIDRNKCITETIELHKGDYRIENDFNFQIEALMMPKVENYIRFGEKTIIFTAGVPNTDCDMELNCKKLFDDVYECISYTIYDYTKTGIELKKILAYLLSFLTFFLIIVLSGVLHDFEDNDLNILMSSLFRILGFLVIGLSSINLFFSVKGFTGFFFKVFGSMFIIAGILDIFM